MEENKENIENTDNIENNITAPENPEPEEQQDSKKKKGNLKQDIIDIAESTICTVFVIVMLFTYLLHPVNIIGHSMVPTLNNTYTGERATTNQTDKVLMSTVFFDIKYGDILVIEKDKNYLLDENGEVYEPDDPAINECIIKRVIACGGQTVDIHDNHVIVDGEIINEPYIAENSTTDDLGAFTGQYPIPGPPGYYCGMG
ncbi:MAG: signal peptidase I, partial [Ruminococcus sp.]|nr:signal peptidase I [Ruminococcus sp.]